MAKATGWRARSCWRSTRSWRWRSSSCAYQVFTDVCITEPLMPPQTLSVSQVTAYIKSLFTMDNLLTDVWVSGEVSNFRPASSGHCYFTLKDGDACLKSVIWRTTARNLRLPRDG